MLGASGALFQWLRLSAMTLVDCMVAWFKLANSTISRSTRLPSSFNLSRNILRSLMRLSISWIELAAEAAS